MFQGLPHCFTWWHLFPAGKYDGAVLRKRLKEGAGPHRLHDTGRVRVGVLTVTSNRDKAMGAAPESCRSWVETAYDACLVVVGAIITPRSPNYPQLFPSQEETPTNPNNETQSCIDRLYA